MVPDQLILSATDLEVAAFLGLCRNTSETILPGNVRLITGQAGNSSFDLLISGPGVFNTSHALAVYLGGQAGQLPDHILQIGIAGVFESGKLDIGDIAVATREHYIHAGVASNSLKHEPLPFDLIPDTPLSRQGIYRFDQARVNACHEKLLEALSGSHTRIAKGTFLTVSTITADLETAAWLFDAFSPVMENMEGAAAAHTAALFNIPLVEIRAASNIVGERYKSNWEIDRAVEQLGWVCRQLFSD